jgi:predicted transcriptional regulator
MSQIAIPEKFTAELRQLALDDNRAVEEIVTEAMHAYLVCRLYEPELTPAQIERLKHSAAQLDRGEVVSGEEIEAFFDKWEKAAASR